MKNIQKKNVTNLEFACEKKKQSRAITSLWQLYMCGNCSFFLADYWKNADKYVSSGEKKMYTSFHCLRDETEKNYLLFLCARMACVKKECCMYRVAEMYCKKEKIKWMGPMTHRKHYRNPVKQCACTMYTESLKCVYLPATSISFSFCHIHPGQKRESKKKNSSINPRNECISWPDNSRLNNQLNKIAMWTRRK